MAQEEELKHFSGHMYEDGTIPHVNGVELKNEEVICMLIGTKIRKRPPLIDDSARPELRKQIIIERIENISDDIPQQNENLINRVAIVVQSCGPEMPDRYRRVGLLEIDQGNGWFKDVVEMSLEII